MSTCERCWRDAQQDLYDPNDSYRDLLTARGPGGTERPCTPEEQAGEDARHCGFCGRRTIHQHTGECMAACPRGGKSDE